MAEIGDTERMAKYVVDLLPIPKSTNDLPEASRQRAIDEFETKLLLPQYTALYNDC